MVIVDKNAQDILDTLICKYVDYRMKGEYGTSAFWNWFYQVKRYMYSLDSIRCKDGDSLVYKMPYWGNIIYSKNTTQNGIIIVIKGFQFNTRNFYNWINHKSLRKPYYYAVGDCGYGYKVIQCDDSPKKGIQAPNSKIIVKTIFDDIIGFHHSTDDYNVVHAIGFINDRVYSIDMNR